MKKIILGLAAVATIAFVGCKNTNKAEQAVDTVVEEVTETVKGLLPNSYTVVPTESVVEWVGTKPAGKHNGTVTVQEGGFAVDNGTVTGGDFTLDMNTITVLDLEGDEKAGLEGHLKGTGKEDAVDHFFNVTKFPTATFVLKSFDGTNVHGDLTVKGVTKHISFPATVTVSDDEVSLVSQPFTINRVDYGINYGSKSIFDDLKDKFINDDVELVVKVKATK
ncbi:MAG: YceI family protein [Capnocytophaga sp.]|nr:YceI family protein [Capnocytophaga sp.]